MGNRISTPDTAPQITGGPTPEAIIDGEKTGMLIRAGAMLSDKLCNVHLPVVSDIVTSVPLTEHVSPSRVMVTSVAAFAVGRQYVHFRSAGKQDESGMENVAIADEPEEDWNWPQRTQY